MPDALRYDPPVRVLSLAVLLATLGCNTIPDRGDPGEVVLDEQGAAKSAVWRIEEMKALLFKDDAPYPPYVVEVRVAGGEEMSRLGLILALQEQRYETCGDLSLFADDEDLPIRGVEYASTVSSNGFLEGWWLDVDVKTLARMASATKSGGRFCEAEWRLDADQRAVLRKLVSKLVR